MSPVSIIPWVRVLCAVTIALGCTALAHADSQRRNLDPPPVKLSFSDLNLDTPAGARVLYGRIKTAAVEACGPSLATWYPAKARAAKECLDETVDHTVKEINRPALTAFHEAGLNHSVPDSTDATGTTSATNVTSEGLYAGLNLSRPADVAQLYRRIATAADEVCEAVSAGAAVAARLRVRKCVAESIARAVENVHVPALTQYYARKTHQPDTSVTLSEAR